MAATDPELLEPLARAMGRWRTRLRGAVDDPLAATQVMLAADAVWYAQVFGLPNADPELRAYLQLQLEELLGE